LSKLEQRHVRLYGPPFALHDVRDVEAHVRTLLDTYLRERGARLDAAKYHDALAYLVALCWKLSGLQGNGRDARLEYWAELLQFDDRGKHALEIGPFPSRERAELAVTAYCAEGTNTIVAVEYVVRAPRGAYDPTFGLAFSTYSRRILSRRVVDWYRATFGDSRYGGNPKPLSLDQLADQWAEGTWISDGNGAADSYLDHGGPGARMDFIDELNRHAYYDPFEERDTRSVTDQGGTDRVAAAR
jgi:hypothetical protein